MAIRQSLKESKLLPIITLRSEEKIDIIKTVIEKSDIKMVEVAFRSDLASQAIKSYAEIDNVIIGAGTVRTLEQAKQAVDCGAKFLVSPGYVPEVVKFSLDQQIPVLPGVLTPTEILRGINEAGLSIFKLFPANLIGGLSGVKALKGPFFDIDFLPTGGVNGDNYLEFLKDDQIIAVGGSFIINDKIEEKDIDREVEKVNGLIKGAAEISK